MEIVLTFCTSNNIIIAGAKRGDNVTPKIGRPHKEITKSVNLGIRITEETARRLKECSVALQMSRTEIIEKGIDLVYKSVMNPTAKAGGFTAQSVKK